MNKLTKLYRRSSWYPVYNADSVGGKARSSILSAVIVQAIVSGFTGGIFYSGLLLGYGINIVNISILTAIPTVCSFFSIFSPQILSRFKHRRVILTVTRILYYTVNILGITLLPQFIHSEVGRIVGLIAIAFTANTLNALFSPGYSPWHMTYITEDIRINYFSSTTLVSQLTSSTVLILVSLIADSMTGDAQINLIITIRYIAFAAAMLDVYFLQRPDEPEYKSSTDRLSLLKVLKIPLTNRRFLFTILVYCVYLFSASIVATSIDAWVINEVKTGYLYINVINILFCVYIPLTSPFWTKMMHKRGTFMTLAISLIVTAPTNIIYAFVSNNNYIWLMTIVRLTQHLFGMGTILSVNNLIYINLPETDRDSYIACYTLLANVTGLLCAATSTSILAAMGTNTLNIFGFSLSRVPVLLFIQAGLQLFVSFVAIALRPWTDPTYKKKE